MYMYMYIHILKLTFFWYDRNFSTIVGFMATFSTASTRPRGFSCVSGCSHFESNHSSTFRVMSVGMDDDRNTHVLAK